MEEIKVYCKECGCAIEEHEEYYEVDGGYVCADCFEDDYFKCEHCGEIYRKSYLNQVKVNGEWMDICDDCLMNDYYYCEHCENYFSEDYVRETCDGNYVCDDCYEDCYFTCPDCGDVCHFDYSYYSEHEDEYYCEYCYDNNGHNRNFDLINGYHDFDDWFKQYVHNENESTLKGFELEIDSRDWMDNDAMAIKLNSLMDKHGLKHDSLVYEEDGSLDNGFEIITQPMTMPFIYANKDFFEEALESIKDYGYLSHDINTCGLHIHVNRKQLTWGTDLPADEVIDNIIAIMETFKAELKTFARRSSSSYARFYSDSCYDDEIKVDKKLVKDFKDKASHDRYMALNLSKYNTIEFRLFKGTLNFKTLMASIELVDNIVEIAKGNIDGLTWYDIIYRGGKYIAEYNASRNISSEVILNIKDMEVVEEATSVELVDGLLPVGARVRVRSDLVVKQDYEWNVYTHFVNSEMAEFMGQYVTIKSHIYGNPYGYQYRIEECGWSWSNEMFELGGDI